MKELNRKIFLTVFLLLSFFIIFGLAVFNIQNYKREYGSIKRNLNIREEQKDFKSKHFPPQLDNMMIMDYEVYTVKIDNNSIGQIISHGNQSDDFDVDSIAKKILKDNSNDTIKIGNLYLNNYAYNYKVNDSIVILNTKTINNKLRLLLLESILVLLLMEILIYYISRVIAKWITKPAIEAFNKQKDFIADASHELKTPLAVIMASSDELKSDKKNEKYIENIKYESERMNTLIASMLDLSKLENGVSKTTYKDENISKIVQKVCLTFESIAYEEEIEIATNIEKDIIFNCSKDEIERLISIIIDNAIKHSYRKSTIKVNMVKVKNNIDIEIINTGDPIQSGDEEKIFERFYRADKSRNRGQNRYGLGLAIAKNIVTNHNGIIKAYSKDNLTTFKINLKK